jgi:PAS domain S-box-containing protein
VARVALRVGQTVYGLLQVNDRRRGCFTPERLARLERLADNLAVAVAHRYNQAKLREGEEQFRTMFEMASIGMAQADPFTGQWLRVNRKLTEITGYSAAEMLQMRVPDITFTEDRARDWDAFQRVVRGEAPDCRLEKRYLRKDGTLAWVNVNMTVLRDSAGLPVRTMATIEDITRKLSLESQFLQAQKMELVWMPDAQPGLVTMDPGQIDQVLANLCVNARDAIGGVGRITIETGEVTLDAAYCAEHAEARPGDYVLLAVSDDGCGMSREVQEHIFEPFFTTKEVGKGTGLRFLQDLGYAVLVAETPAAALTLAGQHPGEIHLLLSDVVMPGMDGKHLAAQLTVVRPALKCLFMSGYTADVVAHRGVLEDGLSFLPKPFSREALADKVRAVLDG